MKIASVTTGIIILLFARLKIENWVDVASAAVILGCAAALILVPIALEYFEKTRGKHDR